jgi:hypothetical protein
VKLSKPFPKLLLCLAVFASASPAMAQTTRTFVSGAGADTGTCGRAAPCRTFAYAVTQTAAHGELDILDTAGYGPVTLTQSISIVNPGGVEAGIAATAGGNAVTITAGATDVIALRGLTLEGLQSGLNGVLLTSGGALEMDNCVARDFTGAGIAIEPGSTTTFRISNSIVEDNQHQGIVILPSGSGAAEGVIDHVAVSGNQTRGIGVNSGSGPATNVSITNSVASGNVGIGIVSQNGAVVSVFNTTIAGNGVGLETNSGTAQLSQSLITGNTTGVSVSGAVNTYQNNSIGINGTDVSGSLTNVSQR